MERRQPDPLGPADLCVGGRIPSSTNLNRALRAGVFHALADGPRTVASLAGQVGMPPLDTRDLLDTLVALGLLERDGPIYSNTAESAYYLDPASPGYAGRMLGSVYIAA